LINNAGLAAGLSRIDNGDFEDWERMIDTNIKGLLYITRLISAKMIERGEGHIVNISSIAGRETYPMGNVYCATKHAVQALTKGMRIDFLKYGIKVSSVSPGSS
jgi:3-hydroxy acid dehydrogenase / malonic semialdehyde reductase